AFSKPLRSSANLPGGLRFERSHQRELLHAHRKPEPWPAGLLNVGTQLRGDPVTAHCEIPRVSPKPSACGRAAARAVEAPRSTHAPRWKRPWSLPALTHGSGVFVLARRARRRRVQPSQGNPQRGRPKILPPFRSSCEIPVMKQQVATAKAESFGAIQIGFSRAMFLLPNCELLPKPVVLKGSQK